MHVEYVRTLTGLAFAIVSVAAQGCAASEISDGAEGSRYVDLVVSDQWAPEQIDEVLRGADFWVARVPELAWLVSVGACDPDAGHVGCIAPVPFEHPRLRDYDDGPENGVVVGSCVGGVVAMLRDIPLDGLALLTAHELGHYLGLSHVEPADAGRNVMAPGLGDMSFSTTPEADAYLRAL